MSEQSSGLGSARRGLFVVLGAGCVGLGAVGIVVPGMPTTVFLLVASYLFARSSPRLHRRLVRHPRFGPYLEMARRGAMPLRAKVISLVAMWAGIGASCLALADVAPVARLVPVALGLAGTAVLLFRVRTLPAPRVSRRREGAAHPPATTSAQAYGAAGGAQGPSAWLGRQGRSPRGRWSPAEFRP